MGKLMIPILVIAICFAIYYIVSNGEKKWEPPDLFDIKNKKVLGWFIIIFTVLLTITYIKFLPFLIKLLVLFADYSIIVYVRNKMLK